MIYHWNVCGSQTGSLHISAASCTHTQIHKTTDLRKHTGFVSVFTDERLLASQLAVPQCILKLINIFFLSAVRLIASGCDRDICVSGCACHTLTLSFGCWTASGHCSSSSTPSQHIVSDISCQPVNTGLCVAACPFFSFFTFVLLVQMHKTAILNISYHLQAEISLELNHRLHSYL